MEPLRPDVGAPGQGNPINRTSSSDNDNVVLSPGLSDDSFLSLVEGGNELHCVQDDTDSPKVANDGDDTRSGSEPEFLRNENENDLVSENADLKKEVQCMKDYIQTLHGKLKDLEEENDLNVSELCEFQRHYYDLKFAHDAREVEYLQKVAALKETSHRYERMKVAARKYKTELVAMKEASEGQDMRGDVDGLIAQRKELETKAACLKAKESELVQREQVVAAKESTVVDLDSSVEIGGCGSQAAAGATVLSYKESGRLVSPPLCCHPRSRKRRPSTLSCTDSEEEKSFKSEEKQRLAMYYLSLPSPYNVIPNQPAPDVEDRRKACKDNRLKSNLGYHRWRSWFMSYFHTAKMPVSAKCEALFKCLEENVMVERRREGMEYDEDGYKQMLEFLEREYGYTRDLWQDFVSQVEELPTIKPNDYDELVDLESLIEIFLAKVKKIGRPEDKCNLYRPISNKFTESLRHKMRKWIDDTDVDYSLENVLRFLKKHIRVLAVDRPQRKPPRDNVKVVNTEEVDCEEEDEWEEELDADEYEQHFSSTPECETGSAESSSEEED